MRTLVVYESWFGNTRRIAEKVAAAIAPESEVELASVDDPVPSLVRVDLVVLGAPTHVHGLSSARSRQGAIDQRGDGAEPGMARRLHRHGYVLAVEPESFFVQGVEGPLEEGELERAWEWGRTLANEVMAPTA